MMTRREAGVGLLASATLLGSGLAAAATPIDLPKPVPSARPLGDALRDRHSTREFADRPLPLPMLSGLLWSAFGINRPLSGDRTAPSWRHGIEAEIYLAMKDGVWRYEPDGHRLLPHLTEDIRAETGTQDFVGTAPLNLVHVANGARMGNASAEDKRLYAFTDAGFIGQNVYLFCAAEGLATVFRGSVDRDRLGRTLRLDAGHFVTFAQTVGFPRGS
jgi:nitroreductase